MRVRCGLRDGWWELLAAEAGIDERRAVGADDLQRFEAWAATYRGLLGRDEAEAQLLALGRELYAWLDGAERWCERLQAAAEAP